MAKVDGGSHHLFGYLMVEEDIHHEVREHYTRLAYH